MQVSIETLSNIERKMHVTVPAAQIDNEVEQQLKSLKGRVKIDGFRPGKVPVSVIKERYQSSVYQDVLNDIIPKTYYQAVQEQAIKVAGQPSITPETTEIGKDLTYVAEFSVYPEVELADMSAIKLEKTTCAVAADNVNDTIDKIRAQNKEWSDVKRAAKDGDQVEIDFEGFVNGEAFDGGKAENFAIELGAGRMIPDFEKQMDGVKAGDEKEIDVAFPEDYGVENLNGVTASFKIKVHAVKASKLPKVDEEFIKAFGIDDGDMKSFKTEIKNNLEREVANRTKNMLKMAVMDQLAEIHEFDIPKALVDQEIEQMRQEMQQNTGTDTSSLPAELFQEQASKRVKLGLVVGEIYNKNEMQIDQQRIQDMLNDMAASYDDPAELVEYYNNNAQAMQTLEAAVMEDMIIEWVTDQAKVEEKEKTFDEIMNTQAET